MRFTIKLKLAESAHDDADADFRRAG